MNTVFLRRHGVSMLLALVFGVGCVALAQQSNPQIWGSALMWMIILNRLTIGAMVSFAGVHDRNPIFGFRMYPALRGTLIGAMVSLQLAVGVYMAPIPDQTSIFFATVLAGAIYGLVIDVVATKLGGEGKMLLYKN